MKDLKGTREYIKIIKKKRGNIGKRGNKKEQKYEMLDDQGYISSPGNDHVVYKQ